MKRIGLFLVAASICIFATSYSYAQKVTLRSSKTSSSVVETEEKVKTDATEKSSVPTKDEVEKSTDSDKSIEMKIDPSDLETVVESKPNAQKTSSSNKKSKNVKSSNGAIDLMTIPTAPLDPMTDAERDQKYPIVPEALEMTLEKLTPTKELRNIRVLKAMARIPRAEFVPKDYRVFAYQDAAIPIGEAQTISPPFIVAYMTETLDPQPTDRVLEIGTGSGYQAAVLSCLVAEVYTIEIVKSLGRRAADTLKKLKYENVFVRLGDGYKGWSEAAPFDKIIVTCSPDDIPQPLIDQLKEGGKMLIPIGERYLQYFVLCEKKNGELIRTTLTPASFVPMTGEAESRRRDKTDPTSPSISGGGFEKVNPTPGEVVPTATWKTDDMVAGSTTDSTEEELDELAIKLPPRRPTPEGWFSTRNIYVADRADAYEGSKVCVCDNASVKEEQKKKDRNEERFAAATLPENRRFLSENAAIVRAKQREQEAICHLRQHLGIDGSAVKKITISGAYRVEKLYSNVDVRNTVSLMKIYFYDKDRKPIVKDGEVVVLSAETRACPWTEFEKEIPVPPRAIEASLQVGILDGVGVVEFDALELKNSNEKNLRSSKRR